MPAIHARGSTLALLAAATVALAAAGGAQPVDARWTVRRDAFAELWYHGLALAGAPSYGPLPLYSPDYRRSVATARESRGVVTSLDGTLAGLRAALARDSVLDILHFLPAYFVGQSPDAVLVALRQALSAEPARGPADELGRRAAAVATALATPARRAIVARFVDGLAAEWDAFLRDDRARRAPDAGAVVQLQRTWRAEYLPALPPALRGDGAGAATIVVVPALGAEGRIARLGGTVVVLVGAADAPSIEDAPLLAAVRELAFAYVDRVPPALVHGPGAPRRATAEPEREVAAVRAGAWLLDAVLPARAAAYRALYAGSRAPEAFDARFVIRPSADSALRTVVSVSEPRNPP